MTPNFCLCKPKKLSSTCNDIKKMFKRFQNHCNTIKINEIMKCSLDFDVAYCVYLDIPNMPKSHHWYTIAMII